MFSLIKEIDENNFIKFLYLINSNGLINSKSYDTSFNGSNTHYNYIALVVHFTPKQKEIILTKIRLLIHQGLASWNDYSQIIWFSFWREPLKEANGRKYFNFNAVKLNQNLTIDYLNSFINLNIFTESYLRKHEGKVSFYPNHIFVKASRYSVIVESLTNYFIKNKINSEIFSFNNNVEQYIAPKSLNLLNYSIDNKCRISFDEDM